MLLASPAASAADPPAEQPVAGSIDLNRDVVAGAADDGTTAPPEAPPPPPYKKTLVLDSSIGGLGFVGQFGKVAPPGFWLRTQLGYELIRWLMVYGEGELGFTDNSNKLGPPNVRAFPLFAFGGGARFSLRFTERFGIYLQAGLGMMQAHIRTNALGIIGFRDAESLGLYLGSRLGVEWFQIDRHFALGLNGGVRLAQGFAQTGGSRDTPLAIDAGVSLRYAF